MAWPAMDAAAAWPIASLTVEFDRSSGIAKNEKGKRALYREDFYKRALVHFRWFVGGPEGFVCTFDNHGQMRDVFSGSSLRAGPLVFKLQPAEFDSTQKEVNVRASLGGKVVDCLWAGEAAEKLH